jgi:glutamate dehydrogenase (NAD(P)+)
LERIGVKVVAVSDVNGGVYNPKGLSYDALTDWINQHRTLEGFPEAEAVSNAELACLDAEILIPAATEGTITPEIARRVKCRILAEGANGPTTLEADRILQERGDVFIIPDVLANAGGVVVSYFEWVQDLQNYFWDEKEINRKLQTIMSTAFQSVASFAKEHQVSMRQAALMSGIKKVSQAMLTRGFYPG